MKPTPSITSREFAILMYILQRDINPNTGQLDPLATPEEIAAVIAAHVDLDRGGVKARSIDAIKQHSPHIYHMAWRHRLLLWDRRVAGGEAVKLRVPGIPRGTLRATIFADLKLPPNCHLEVGRFPEDTPHVIALIIIKRSDAAHLLAEGSVHYVAGQKVTVAAV